jgi:chemotaxis protein MotD
VADAVAVVVAVATAPVATPGSGGEAPATPAAIAAAATAAIAAAASPAQNTDPSLAEKPTATAAGTGTAVAAELTAVLPTDGTAPEADAAKIVAAAGVIYSANGKTEVSAKNAETTASIKEGKDGKQAADQAAAVTDQAIKPETGASNTDGKPGQHDKAASDTVTESPERTAKTASQSERNASAAPAPLPATQSDPGLLSPAGLQQQPVQSHTANLTAIPVTPAQAALAANTPVPLNSLAADIALRAAGGNSRFEIRLDPAELGRIDVRLEVDKHGNVTSHLTVERPATLDMLRNDAPKLQQALENAGLKTGDSGLQFSLRDQSSSGQNSDNGSGRNSQRVVITDEDTVPAQVAGRTYGRTLGSSGGVDIRI